MVARTPRGLRATAEIHADRASWAADGDGGDEAGEPPAPGRLYVIDLAGSERAADSKDHSKERMEETKVGRGVVGGR